MSPPVSPVLELDRITKCFGEVAANREVSWSLESGMIYALLGENGAGKSTLMSVLAGRYQPDSGEIRQHGRTVRFPSPAQALAAGIGMVYQRFMLVGSLSVTENILLQPGVVSRAGAADHRRVGALAERYGLQVDPRAIVGTLSMGERQRVEILKLLYRDAGILIFDEPTAVLTHTEIDSLFSVFRRLRQEEKTVVFITHKLEEVMAVADRIAVMRRGRMVSRLAASEVRSRHDLARLMVGREVILSVEKPPVTIGEPVLQVEGASGFGEVGRPGFAGINFSVRRGEVFAVTGVAGNGQEALAAALAGLGRMNGGTIRFCGRAVAAERWHRQVDPRIAYVPEDRYRTGSIESFSLVENFMLTRLGSFGGLFLDRRRAMEQTREAVTRYGIRSGSLMDHAGHLSGGNLQKLILSRELSRAPELLIAEQPTQGLDIQATEEIWQALLQQRESAAILLITGDLREALSLSDRIAVMFRGRILGVVSSGDEDGIDRIKLLMAGLEGDE